MPLHYLRRLSGRRRHPQANRDLGLWLAFVAGAANAGGFLAVQQYTSHMTGILSTMADDFALGRWQAGLWALLALCSFISGAATTAILINWARRRKLHSEYALALLLEAGLMLLFGMGGVEWGSWAQLPEWVHRIWLMVLLLCFIMGLQNAIITKISAAQIRTTHITGLVTDIGIELGKAMYWNRNAEEAPVRADLPKLRLLAGMLLMFAAGAYLGALGFKHLGPIAVLPLALILLILAAVPVLDDVRHYWRAPASKAGDGDT